MGIRVLIACHVAAGLVAVTCGVVAMLAPKRPGRHPRWGRAYLAALASVVVTGTMLAATDWAHLWHLPALGAVAVALAGLGYTARRLRWPGWTVTHIPAMGGSYIAMLTAFYVDNGPRLPLWNQLPPVAFWFLPAAVGAPLIAWALRRRFTAALARSRPGCPSRRA
ncbi:MAG: DUF2306 domain-containing protein [Micromonosporaceae bacterium]|nr:DUF2306 domain-containing protein [Micromonosporaceae bacterium]